MRQPLSTASITPDSPASPTPPVCPSCGRTCEPGSTWPGANYCRGLILLGFIEARVDSSAWELAQASGIPYDDVTRGLLKLRGYGLVHVEQEERLGEKGYRFRYWPSGDSVALERFTENMKRAEAL